MIIGYRFYCAPHRPRRSWFWRGGCRGDYYEPPNTKEKRVIHAIPIPDYATRETAAALKEHNSELLRIEAALQDIRQRLRNA